jgi:hypothetical protein
MYNIYKITSHPVVDFAAEELKKYLRMLMPRCGEIPITYAPAAKDGFRLGLMADFCLDTAEATDIDLDDIITSTQAKRAVSSQAVICGAFCWRCTNT